MATRLNTTVAPALAFPKPVGALAVEYDREMGRLFAAADLTKPERALLRHIADNADLLNLSGHANGEFMGPHWLVVPLSRAMLDVLAAFEADHPERDDSDLEVENEGDDREDLEDEHQQLPNPAPAWREGRLKPARQVAHG